MTRTEEEVVTVTYLEKIIRVVKVDEELLTEMILDKFCPGEIFDGAAQKDDRRCNRPYSCVECWCSEMNRQNDNYNYC